MAVFVVVAVGLAVLVIGALYRLGQALLPTREGRRCVLVTIVSLAMACGLVGWRYLVILPETFYVQLFGYRVSIVDIVNLATLLTVAVFTPWIGAALRQAGTFTSCFFRSLGDQLKATLAML
jgi:hypothetical protein